MTGLSEKAKGKQRAIDITPIEGNGQPPVPTQRPLTIRFTDGLPDLVLTLDAKDAVRDIKQKVTLLYSMIRYHANNAGEDSKNSAATCEAPVAPHLLRSHTCGQLIALSMA